MKTINLLAVCFVVMLGAASAQIKLDSAAQDNLLSNGGFNAAGWPPSSDGFDALLQGWRWNGFLAWTYRPEECLDGGGQLGFGGAGSISQLVNTTVGQTYRLTLTARSFADPGSPPGHLLPEWGGVALPVADAPVDYSTWAEISYDVQAVGTTTLFQLSSVDNGPVWVDSVSLVAIPEPGFLSIWFLGVGGMWAYRRWAPQRREGRRARAIGRSNGGPLNKESNPTG